MVNPYRGEVALGVNGARRVMRLSLGALAALEARLECGSLVALVARFEEGAFRTADLVALLAAGLGMAEDEVMRAEFEGGPMAAARAAAVLLKLTFVVPGTGDPAGVPGTGDQEDVPGTGDPAGVPGTGGQAGVPGIGDAA